MKTFLSGAQAQKPVGVSIDRNPTDYIQVDAEEFLAEGATAVIWPVSLKEARPHKTASIMLVAKIVDMKSLCLLEYWKFDDETRDAMSRHLQRETELLAKCSTGCKFIVDLVSAFNWNNKFWLVLERCSPGSFAESVLPYADLSEEQLRCTLYCALKALEHMNSLGVVHGDLRGANLLLDQTGIVKLCDFGSARKAGEIMERGLSIAPISWAPPETWSSYLDQTLPSSLNFVFDTWSVGILVVELFSSKGNFTQEDIAEKDFVEKATHQERFMSMVLQNDMSPLLRDFVQSCLTYDANSRPRATCLLRSRFVRRRGKIGLHRRPLIELARQVQCEKDG